MPSTNGLVMLRSAMRSAHQHANENSIASCHSSGRLVYLHESVDPPLGYHRRMKTGWVEAQLMVYGCPDTSRYFHSSPQAKDLPHRRPGTWRGRSFACGLRMTRIEGRTT